MRSLEMGLGLVLSWSFGTLGCDATSGDVARSPSGGPGGSAGGFSGGASGGGAGTASEAASGGSASALTGGSSGAGGPGNGGSAAAGSNGAGGGDAGGTAGNDPSGGAGGWSVPTCTNGIASPGLPPSAPDLVPGVWTDISPSQPNFAGEPGAGAFAQGIAIDPCNPANLYLTTEDFAVSAQVGMYKSTDAGGSWTKVSHLDEPIRVRVDPNDGNHLYAGDGVRGSTQGFFVSTDAGVTFAQPQGFKDIASFPDNPNVIDVYDIAVDPQDFDHVLVSSHSAYGWDTTKWNKNAGIIESTDGGESWTVHDPQPGWGYGHGIWFLSNSTTWLLGTQGSGFWRTTNSGSNWTQATTTNMTHGGGQVYYATSGTVYAASEAGVIRSTNDGVTWETVGSAGGITGVYGDGTTLYTHHCYGEGDAAFQTSPESDGITWQNFTSGGAFSNGPFELAFDAANGILYSGNWGNGMLALKVAE